MDDEQFTMTYDLVKPRPQVLQTSGLLSSWFRRCLTKCSFRLKLFVHPVTVHANSFSVAPFCLPPTFADISTFHVSHQIRLVFVSDEAGESSDNIVVSGRWPPFVAVMSMCLRNFQVVPLCSWPNSDRRQSRGRWRLDVDLGANDPVGAMHCLRNIDHLEGMGGCGSYRGDYSTV